MSLRSALGISGRWFQIVLAGVTVAVSLIRWLLCGDPDIARVLVFVFVTGNITVFGPGGQLQAAFEMQANLLPKTIPQIPGLQISYAWQPAHVVSGDYFDVIAFSPKKIGVSPISPAKESEPPCKGDFQDDASLMAVVLQP